ncbi:hypothetical protein BDW68DRAFT_192801 [Aspergillus falconensis]
MPLCRKSVDAFYLIPQTGPRHLILRITLHCALISDGGSGLCKAIPVHLLCKGKRVIIAGQTEPNLHATVKETGGTDYCLLNTGYPDLDHFINSPNIQRPLQVLKDDPAEFLAKADQKIDINGCCPFLLTLGLLEHSMTLRMQLSKGDSEKTEVIGIALPSDPDDNKKHKNPNALTAGKFMEETAAALEGSDEIQDEPGLTEGQR